MNHRITVTAAILALIAGCNSSSDDCGAFTNCVTDPGSPGAGGLAVIDRDNALVILREAWFAASTAPNVAAFVVATGVGDMSGGSAVAPGNAAKIAMRNSVPLAPVGPATYNCPTSGTFTITGDIADMNTVTAGDFATYDSTACDSGTGYTVDGTFRIDINGIIGDPLSGQFEQTQLLTFTDFQATAGSATTYNGDHTAIIDSRSAGEISVSFGGNSLIIDEQQISITIRNFTGLYTIQTGSPFNTSLFAAGTASSTVVQGSFDFVTEEVMDIALGQAPTDGILDVFGSGSSTARVAVVSDTVVNIQVDTNGSGNFEVSSSVSWQEFLTGNLVLNWTDTGLN